MPPQRESWLVYSILDTWGRHPAITIWRANSGVAQFRDRAVRFGIPGQADISGIGPDGTRIEIEAKTATGKQRPEQAAFQRMIERHKGAYCLARSLDDVDALMLKRFGLRRDVK